MWLDLLTRTVGFGLFSADDLHLDVTQLSDEESTAVILLFCRLELEELFVISDLMSLFDLPKADSEDSMQLFDRLRLVDAEVVVVVVVGGGSVSGASGI